MGVEFLKKKNERYQRRRRRLFEAELRQGGLFRVCPPEQLTHTRAQLLGRSLIQAGEFLWGRLGKSAEDILLLRQAGKDVAQIPASIVPALVEEMGTSDEVVAEVLRIDSARGQVDLRLSPARKLRCQKKSIDSV